jgi:Arc/MetJ-type ribon-helix-helix transcriptional regulator
MAKLRDITVPLPHELHQFLKRKVKEDDYLDPADVVREALLEFKEQDEYRQHKLQRLRQQVGVAVDESRRGLSRPFDAAAIRRIETAAKRRPAARRNGKR